LCNSTLLVEYSGFFFGFTSGFTGGAEAILEKYLVK
jgi:hypothetical protein